MFFNSPPDWLEVIPGTLIVTVGTRTGANYLVLCWGRPTNLRNKKYTIGRAPLDVIIYFENIASAHDAKVSLVFFLGHSLFVVLSNPFLYPPAHKVLISWPSVRPFNILKELTLRLHIPPINLQCSGYYSCSIELYACEYNGRKTSFDYYL